MGQDGGIGLLTFGSELADRTVGVNVRALRSKPEDSVHTGSAGVADAPGPKIGSDGLLPLTTPHAARSSAPRGR